MESEIELNSDILQPIPLEKWPLLQELLKVEWPNYANYYYWIQNCTKWKKLNPDLAIQIYCPQGKYKEDVTFVAISGFSVWSVVVFTKEPSQERLHEALLKTNRFDWSKGVVFRGLHEKIQHNILSVLSNLQTNRGIEISKKKSVYYYIKPANDCLNVEIKVPDECYLGDLDQSHLSIIHPIWPNADKELPENTIKLLQAMIMFNKSIGLFLKEGNVLVSWALQDDWYSVGVVQTLESYQKRGYAKVVVNALAKQIAEEGVSPGVYITCGNIPSEKMFASLNWKCVFTNLWIMMKKQLPNTD